MINTQSHTHHEGNYESNGRHPGQSTKSSPDHGRPPRQQTPPWERKVAHAPKGSSDNEQMYILTLLTDDNLHGSMTQLRKKHFPEKLNKLEAHITLFHALPESKLSDVIIPAVEELASQTTTFEVAATTPFKLKHGIAIGMPKDHGGNASRSIHRKLHAQWKDFLSQQDSSFQAHYTIMNKVDEEAKIAAAFDEVQNSFQAVFGSGLGLSLFRYNRGAWEWTKEWKFKDH